jgi:hypothetical protein
MTREQMIDDIDRMTNAPFRDDYEERCKVIGAKFRAAVERHGITLCAADSERLRELECGKKYVWARTHTMIELGVPAIEVWAIVKSTLEGKS